MATSVAKKKQAFIFKHRPLGPASFNIWGMLTNVDMYIINTYHHTKSRIKRLPQLSKTKQALYILVWAPGANILQQKGQSYHCGGVWRIKTNRHTKPELSSCLSCLEKSRPFIFKYRPLGSTSFNIWGMLTIVDCVDYQYLLPY